MSSLGGIEEERVIMSREKLQTMRSDTFSVSIGVPPLFAWEVLSHVDLWRLFSPFALTVTSLTPDQFEIDSPQGKVILCVQFDRDRLLLDHVVKLSDGSAVFIPYRVVPNYHGCELVMTNIQSPGDSTEDYEVQVGWMRDELRGAKAFIEERYGRDGGKLC